MREYYEVVHLSLLDWAKAHCLWWLDFQHLLACLHTVWKE